MMVPLLCTESLARLKRDCKDNKEERAPGHLENYLKVHRKGVKMRCDSVIGLVVSPMVDACNFAEIGDLFKLPYVPRASCPSRVSVNCTKCVGCIRSWLGATYH